MCPFSFWGDFDWKVKAQIAILTWYLAPRFLKYVLEYHPGFLGEMQTCLSLRICLMVKRNKRRTERIHCAVSGHRASPFSAEVRKRRLAAAPQPSRPGGSARWPTLAAHTAAPPSCPGEVQTSRAMPFQGLRGWISSACAAVRKRPSGVASPRALNVWRCADAAVVGTPRGAAGLSRRRPRVLLSAPQRGGKRSRDS